MTKQHFDAEKNFLMAIAIAKNMLESDVINEKDFRDIKALLIKKYNPLVGSL